MTHRVSDTLSDDTLNRIIQIESAGKLKAKAPTSSALGLFQFLNATWLGVVRKHRPDLQEGRTQAEVLALRVDPTTCIELGARFTEDNARALGDGYTDGDLYLAHFLGIATARKFFRSTSGASAETLAGPAAVRANRTILAGKTVGQVRAWAQKSMVSRWEKAGRPDWIARYYDDARTVQPDDPGTEFEPPRRKKTGITEGGAIVGAGTAVETLSTANEVISKVSETKHAAASLGVMDYAGALFSSPRFLLSLVALLAIACGVLWWQYRKRR
jgi:hypothetical protein